MSKLLAGRYELVDKIGEGGMAVVYKGKDRLLNRYVAIKILRPEFTRDEKFVENFKRESQAAAGLQHPNIVAVYDVGVAGSINYIVMELVEGRTLSEIIDEQAPLDYKVAIDYAKQMASALALAHKNQIVHRDVKPHNILVTEDGVAKLADFGIARAVSSVTAMADTNKIIGSVHYFSPEQARGTYVDERSDIYSLGIVIYEMLTGKVPFDGDNPVEVALKHINEDIVPPSKLVKGIPPNLERLVLKATDKFQTNRYKTADEMLEDLTSVEFVTNYLKDRPDLVVAGMPQSRSGSQPVGKTRTQQVSKQAPSSYKGGGYSGGDSGKKGSPSQDSGKDKGRKRLTILLVLLLLAVLVPGGIYFAGKLTGNSGEVKVPKIVDMTFEEAKEELAKVNLNIERGEDISSDDVEAGKIAQQLPAPGSNVKEGKTIMVRISTGPGEISVPDLTNLTYDEASARLTALGLKVIRGESKHSETVPADRVAGTDPEAGKTVKPGETVAIIMSSGPEETTDLVPNLYGLDFDSESSIDEYLRNYDFVLGSVTEEESGERPGRVLRQSPEPGAKAERGSAINVVIAKEVTSIEVPSFSGKTLEAAQADASAYNLVVVMGNFVDDPTGSGTPGTVINQSIAAGEKVEKGTTITVDIIKDRPEPEPEPTPEPTPEPDPGEGGSEEGGNNEG